MTSITDIIADIRKAMEGATPGPWEAKAQSETPPILYVSGPSEIIHPDDGVCQPERFNDRSFAEDAANMRYIAACNPSNIAALLDALEKAEAEVARMKSERLYVIGFNDGADFKADGVTRW